MSILLRPADLEADGELLLGALSSYLSPDYDRRRFDWLYNQCPHGRASAWIATDGASGSVVGAAAFFPRMMVMNGADVRACVLGDFCIHPKYRSLGPALQLQRACLRELDLGMPALAYDFPSVHMMPVYKRLGVQQSTQLLRFAKPIRVDKKIGNKLRSPSLARGLGQVANPILAWRDRALVSKSTCEFALLQGPFGAEFSALAKQLGSRCGACVQRSAEYLNWRYRAHPFRRYDVLTARRSGALAGFAVFSQEGSDANIVDLLALDEGSVLSGLLACVANLVRERGTATLNASLHVSHPWGARLRKMGFRPRESQTVVIYPQEPSGESRLGSNQSPWLVMDGDRES